ncbi:hypothetical protein Lser_V15G41077 [Lactuca serriola]
MKRLQGNRHSPSSSLSSFVTAEQPTAITTFYYALLPSLYEKKPKTFYHHHIDASPAESIVTTTTSSSDYPKQNLNQFINSIQKTLGTIHRLYLIVSSFNVSSQLPLLQCLNTLVMEMDNMAKVSSFSVSTHKVFGKDRSFFMGTYCMENSNNSYLGKGNSEGKLVTGVQLTEEEENEIGNVGWKPFLDYIVISKGLWILSLCVLSQSSFVVLQAAGSYWLAFASKSFFTKFTDSITRAPMVFFDSTPVGRILTRTSSNQSVIDFDIPFVSVYSLAAGIDILAMIFIMASVTWQVLIIAIFGIVASKYVQHL